MQSVDNPPYQVSHTAQEHKSFQSNQTHFCHVAEMALYNISM